MMTYRTDWAVIPSQVQKAIQELQEAVEDHTDWAGAQVTVGEEITVDVQVTE